MKKQETNSSEPYFYVALVLKGTEKQYLNLLKYVNNRNGAQVIYQCKSLTYLHIARENGSKIKPANPELLVNAEQAEVASQ